MEDDKPELGLHIVLDIKEARDFHWLMNRAVNCLEPNKWPPIASFLLSSLETFIKHEKDH